MKAKRLEQDLAALETMSPAQLREKWAAIGDGPVPSVPAGLLQRLVAHRLQERRFGRLSPLVARELEAALQKDACSQPQRQRVVLTPGTRLIREWNGRTIAVEVREKGFVWEDRAYRSLSEIARAVTGAHWSGPRFFGLRRNG